MAYKLRIRTVPADHPLKEVHMSDLRGWKPVSLADDDDEGDEEEDDGDEDE